MSSTRTTKAKEALRKVGTKVKVESAQSGSAASRKRDYTGREVVTKIEEMFSDRDEMLFEIERRIIDGFADLSVSANAITVARVFFIPKVNLPIVLANLPRLEEATATFITTGGPASTVAVVPRHLETISITGRPKDVDNAVTNIQERCRGAKKANYLLVEDAQVAEDAEDAEDDEQPPSVAPRRAGPRSKRRCVAL